MPKTHRPVYQNPIRQYYKTPLVSIPKHHWTICQSPSGQYIKTLLDSIPEPNLPYTKSLLDSIPKPHQSFCQNPTGQYTKTLLYNIPKHRKLKKKIIILYNSYTTSNSRNSQPSGSLCCGRRWHFRKPALSTDQFKLKVISRS